MTNFFNSRQLNLLLASLDVFTIRFPKTAIFLTILILQPALTPDSFAHARRRPPRAYSFIAEGGKASQAECDGERKIPRRLKRQKDFSKASSYMGSELLEPELKGKIDGEMWKHFFRAKSSCNAVLAKTPSALEETQKNTKDIPPEEDVEEADSSNGADSDPETDADADAEEKLNPSVNSDEE